MRPLPGSVGVFRLAGPPLQVRASGIFDYMNGAGELYLGYRFELLEAAEFEAVGQPRILVERYLMGSSDDAFGVLSTDWGGEPVDLTGSSRAPGWPPRALYGAGLLRLRSGPIFARVMADRETAAARAAVLDLGRAIVGGGGTDAPPAVIGALPATLARDLALQRDRSVFFRSHLILNSVYFLSHANILALGTEAAAVAAQYRRPAAGSPAVHVIVIHYPAAETAAAARHSFAEAYLGVGTLAAAGSGGVAAARVEDGWVGLGIAGEFLALAFGCGDESEARSAVAQAVAALAPPEVRRE